MIASNRPIGRARLRGGTFGLVLLALSLWLAAGPAAAGEGELGLELNKVEDASGGCAAYFLFRNDLGATLDRLNLDIFLFDREGVILRQVLIDLAPLRQGKTRVARFSLTELPCADLGRILVNDIPACRADDGRDLDCVAALRVNSRAAIDLAK